MKDKNKKLSLEMQDLLNDVLSRNNNPHMLDFEANALI
jgi:hypothetical protein